MVDADLERFEAVLAASIIVGDEFLDSVTTHLTGAGGKYLRPTLAISSATGGVRRASEDDLLGAVALELMHLASLYHDDVLDKAKVRRNVDTVNARYGNLVAIVAGDFLMAQSAGIAARLGTDFAELLANTLMLAHARPDLGDEYRLLGRSLHQRLLRHDRGKDGVTDVRELSDRGDDRWTQPRADRRVERLRP